MSINYSEVRLQMNNSLTRKHFSVLTSNFAPSTCVPMYGGFLSFMYWNILFSPFMNSILCSRSSETVWLQTRVAVVPYVTYCGAISCTFMCTAGVASENHEITVQVCCRCADVFWQVVDTRADNRRSSTRYRFGGTPEKLRDMTVSRLIDGFTMTTWRVAGGPRVAWGWKPRI